MKHSPKQITLDLAEWIEIQSELNSLRATSTGEELTEAEQQEATGELLVRALQNPNLFREVGSGTPINIGNFTASFTVTALADSRPSRIRVKFVRTP